MELWAQALANKIPGVSVISPLNSLRYLNCCNLQSRSTRSRQQAGGIDASSTLAEIGQWLAGQSRPHHPASPPSSVVGKIEHTLGKYLEFVQVSPHKSKEVLHTLLTNNTDNYTIFRSLSVEFLAALGYTIGVIIKLRLNVVKYQAHLATRH
ncbi:hypothetical protein PCANC_00394 [Puccinia coronata f. sp. avenae]|uniref:Uncharacterized protein n=1 Tax=Puccinia coronata f. sp. avenae TaxID=200324 RepID=A0A2N5VQ63_9BASI|nr:hypothetical protein PCASD_02030 [Puccinia coronata f. sp. avenae]PLW58689.1 hypothetical protein PCANC_00394 [Puccinia coronata f. sp. avenae]